MFNLRTSSRGQLRTAGMGTILHTLSTSFQDGVMTVRLPASEKDGHRKFRAQRKQRVCRNCKLRKVKCDLSKPECKRCTAFGVFCNYDCKYSDLQLSVDGAFDVEIQPRFHYARTLTIPSMIGPSVYQLDEQNLELLCKFQARTALTISTGESLLIYQNEIINLACSHPFLMHTILTLTLMHDRYLSAAPTTKQSATEAFHWHQGTALFNSKLSKPVQDSERAALWATAALLGTIVFCHIEAKTPEEAWPLKPPSSSDLHWLRMIDGKKEIWKIIQPLGADSLLQALAPAYANDFLPASLAGPELEALPSEFIKLYGLDATSTIENNPYHAAASTLGQSMNIDSPLSIILNFLCFITNMRPDYKRLLERKDPCALLLLACWYAKVCQYQHWWIWRRAALECQAICMYLERYYRHETNIQRLLRFPRMMYGTVAC